MTGARRTRGLTATVASAGIVIFAFASGAPAAAVRHQSQPSAVARGPLSVQQALSQAVRSRHAVAVPGATTATDTLTANPNGTLTLHNSQLPVRKLVNGAWRPLDATLRRGSGGSIVPATTTSALRLSGGGRGPLATMSAQGRSLAMWLPASLPVPVLSGSSATYPGVWPGVDVRVTADKQGGFSETLIVHSRAAATDPAVRRLVLATRATGLRLAAGRAGNITAADPAGHTVFAAPTPFMWDSAAAAAGTRGLTNPMTGQRVDARSGLPLASTAAGPGEGAHTASVPVTAAHRDIILTPGKALLTAPSTVFPVYIDPTFTAPSAGSSRNEWTTVNNGFPNQSYWKTSGLLQVGDQGWQSPYFVARSFVNMPVPSQIHGATVLSAQLNFTEEWSPSCTAKPVQLWSTGPISSGTTWNSQPGWNSEIGSQTVAYGYNSSCPAHGVGFDVSSIMQSAANKSTQTQETFGLRAGDESDAYGWKQFANTATMSITYDHAPNTPSGMTTSPATSCTASTPTTVGDGAVSLYVPVSDPDGGTLGVTYALWKTSDSAKTPIAGTPTNPQNLFVSSGSTAVFIATEAALKAAAGGAVTEFSWHAQVTDYHFTSSWSATCNFYFDPTRPGSPVVTLTGAATIGAAATVTIAPPVSGTTPTAYTYQLNATAPGTVTASGGDATVTVTPTRFTNVLTVTSLSAGGNIGDSASVVFNATPAAPAADGDLTGDGVPDLLAVGGQDHLPSGLWLAAGKATGQVNPAATDIGAQGNGVAGDEAPADFNGAQVISGHFTGTGLQDVLAYYPAGTNPGEALILAGSGDGSVIEAQESGIETTVPAGVLTDANGDNPLQLANAGDTSGQGYAYPDLIATSGDATNGYYLDFYPNGDGLGSYGVADTLTTATPDGTMDWNDWTIATAQLPTGTAMYLWDRGTGALYLWEDLAYNLSSGTLSYTQYAIASNWNTGAALSLEATDINGDGTPDLWTVNSGGTATAWLLTGLSGTPSLTAQPGQALAASDGGGPFTPVTPIRILNTRNGTGAPAAPIGPGGTLSVQVSGNNGIPSNATAVVLSVIALSPTANGFLTVYPDGQSRPGTSNVNFTAGQTITNLVTVPVTDGKVDFWNSAGSTYVVADLQGYYAPGTGSLYTGTASARMLDTRNGTGAPTAPIGPGGTLALTVTGLDGVPTDATAVVLNVTVAGPTAGGYLTVFPDGQSLPGTSNIDFSAGQTLSDLVTVPVTDGKVDFYNSAGSTNVVADLQGYFAPEDASPCSCAGSLYTGVAPVRMLDTRNGTGAPEGTLGSGGVLSLQVAGVDGVPAAATAVILNIAVVGPTANSFLTVYPDGQDKPATSNVNFTAGQTIALEVVVPVFDGKVDFWNHGGSINLVADLQGYYLS